MLHLLFLSIEVKRRYRLAAVGYSFLVVVTSAGAQVDGSQETVSVGGPKRVVSIVPRLSITEMVTDNALLTSVGRQSEQITEVSPGIRITSDGARVKGYFDYSLLERLYGQGSSGRRSQNALNTFGSIEAIDGFGYLDFNGGISQQAISALGTQSVGNLFGNSNLTESSTYRLSPYLRGSFSGLMNYEARYSLTTNHSQSALVSDVKTVDILLRIEGKNTPSNFSWSADASRQNIAYSAGRSTEADVIKATLAYSLSTQLDLSLIAGQERNNYTTLDKETYGVSGFGVNWRPLEGTKFSVVRQNRSFGASHNLSFEHRTPRTAWRISDSKDVSVTPSQSSVGLGSIYDLYFTQFAAIEPDVIKRAALVSNFLQANGINPNGAVTSSFLTSAVSVQRRQDLSFAVMGIRDTVTFMATQSEGSRLDTISGVTDDLSGVATVRQRGLSVSYAHRLTPWSAVNFLVSTQMAASALGLQDTTMKSVNISLSTKVGTQSNAVFGARHVVFESGTAPYTETAITGAFNLQF